MKRENPFEDAETFKKRLKEKAEKIPKATLQDVEKVLEVVKNRLVDPKNYPWYVDLDKNINWSDVHDYFPGILSKNAFPPVKNWVRDEYKWSYRFTDFSVEDIPESKKVTRKMKNLYEELIKMDNEHLDGDAEIINDLLDRAERPTISFFYNERRMHPLTPKLMKERGFEAESWGNRMVFFVKKTE